MGGWWMAARSGELLRVSLWYGHPGVPPGGPHSFACVGQAREASARNTSANPLQDKDISSGCFRGEAAPASLKHAHDMLEEQVHPPGFRGQYHVNGAIIKPRQGLIRRYVQGWNNCV